MSKKFKEIKWLSDVESHDYVGALSYLELIFTKDRATEIVELLKIAPITKFKAKDIFRSSKENPLGISNFHIKSNIKKIKKGKKLSPLLLFRDIQNNKIIIVDGYHRICTLDMKIEDTWVPCKIV